MAVGVVVDGDGLQPNVHADDACGEREKPLQAAPMLAYAFLGFSNKNIFF